jgi:hypothetical protein
MKDPTEEIRLPTLLLLDGGSIGSGIDLLRKRRCTRVLDVSRLEGVSYLVINACFDALTNLFLENSYSTDAIFDVDGTGFALGTTLPWKVLIESGDTTAYKKISRR